MQSLCQKVQSYFIRYVNFEKGQIVSLCPQKDESVRNSLAESKSAAIARLHVLVEDSDQGIGILLATLAPHHFPLFVYH